MHGNFIQILVLLIISSCLCIHAVTVQQNKTLRHARKSNENTYYKEQQMPAYRSYQPVLIKYHKTSYPKPHGRNDYDIASYDTEYGAVVSNFTSSIYDDNSPLYPNPEFLAKTNQVDKNVDIKTLDADLDIPDDSLADSDLKEHNIIDSVTYLYGFNSCHGVRNEWMVLIFITSGIACFLLMAAVIWLMWSEYAAEFRKHSKLYPIVINLCCCLVVCTLIFVRAIMGVSSPSQCEKIAILLHYTHIICSTWILALAFAVSEYCVYGTVLPLKFNYLLAYGVPAIFVMFDYALSVEHYEIKHYCWMSIEKGMVIGFMVPAMIFIVVNTGVIILGLQSVNKKQAEMIAAKIQELVDHHLANWPKNEQCLLSNESIETLDMFTPGSSRKNTDNSDSLDKEYNSGDEDCQYINVDNMMNNEVQGEETDANIEAKSVQDKNLMNMLYMDSVSLKWNWNTEGNDLKTYLNLCLVLEPFFAINWVMGVVAIENAAHWSTPTIYLILVVCMYLYLTLTICTTLPIVKNKETELCCEEVIAEPTVTRSRTLDSIPLLDPAIQQPNVTQAPADTISTISI